jgi:predicted nucleic acid-binding protein
MTVLVDTSILGRLANTNDPSYAAASFAVMELRRRGETLCTAAQNMIEFRNFATRPLADNGLGLSVSDARTKSEEFETVFPVVTDAADVYQEWKLLADESAVVGKQVHDVRLVAICRVSHIPRILTFNTRHFLRFAAHAPGISIISPNDPSGW